MEARSGRMRKKHRESKSLQCNEDKARFERNKRVFRIKNIHPFML